MRREITNNALFMLDVEFSAMAEKLPAVAFLLDEKIRRFYTQNMMSLKILHKNMGIIQKRYILHNDEGKAQKAADEKGDMQWIFLESVAAENGELLTGEKVAQAYFEDAGIFLNRSITVEV